MVTFLTLTLVTVLIEETVLETVTGITDTTVEVFRRVNTDVDNEVNVVVLCLTIAFFVVETDVTVSESVTVDVLGLILLVTV